MRLSLAGGEELLGRTGAGLWDRREEIIYRERRRRVGEVDDDVVRCREREMALVDIISRQVTNKVTKEH